jgi:hypothetical protein
LVGVGVAVPVGVGELVAVAEEVALRVGVSVAVWVGVGEFVLVAVGVAVSVGVGEFVLVTVGVLVEVGVPVLVGVGVRVGVRVEVLVGEGVRVGDSVGVCVLVEVGVGVVVLVGRVENSYAPISSAGPCGRRVPSKSEVIPAIAIPASINGEEASKWKSPALEFTNPGSVPDQVVLPASVYVPDPPLPGSSIQLLLPARDDPAPIYTSFVPEL